MSSTADKGWLQSLWDKVKREWTLDGGRSGGSDRDNFVTNRVTVADYDDAAAYGSVAAVGLTATWACVTLIAGTIASLPLFVYRTDAKGTRTVARDHSLFALLRGSPNADQSAVEFWDFMSASVELAGNGYAPIDRSGDRIVALSPINPDGVRIERREMGRLWYRWSEDGRVREVPQEQMLHLRGPGGGPLGGASPLAKCRQAFNAALSAQHAAAATFRNGVRPSGVLTQEARFSSAEIRAEAEALIQEKFVGSMNAGRPMLLDGGLKWEQLSINPEDAQLLETRRFSVEEVCRIFGVPPHMIGHNEKSTSWGSGLEQQTIGFVIYTLRRRLKRIEAALEKQLLTPAERAAGMTIEFNLEGLLRGDSKGRAEFYRTMTGIGAMTINEVRAKENLPPVTGGDVPRLQMQNVPISAADQNALGEEE
ncbi:MAG TPA: phage portal protein [Sphingomicrobium sp.]